jgi:hypothetical protein
VSAAGQGTVTRAERAQVAAALRAEGLLQREIAERMGLSRSYTSALLADPTGDADKARKDRYRGVCEACGGPTTGAEGPAKTPRFCCHCAPNLLRKWTPERIVEAAREWARRYGHAPNVHDWSHRSVDPDGYEFPPATSCYDNGTGETRPPFESWADVIAAAGFPRPSLGINRRDNQHLWEVSNMSPKALTRPYLVFRVEEDGRLALHCETQARTTAEAIEQSVEETGTFAAVAKSSLTEYQVASRLVASARRNGTGEDQ